MAAPFHHRFLVADNIAFRSDAVKRCATAAEPLGSDTDEL